MKNFNHLSSLNKKPKKKTKFKSSRADMMMEIAIDAISMRYIDQYSKDYPNSAFNNYPPHLKKQLASKYCRFVAYSNDLYEQGYLTIADINRLDAVAMEGLEEGNIAKVNRIFNQVAKQKVMIGVD